MELNELKSGARVSGLVAAGVVTVVAVEAHSDSIVNVVFRDVDGNIADRLLTAEHAAFVSVATGRRWTFDADGVGFKLASEARRIQLAHLFDPFAAVGSSTIQPLPHQIEAVYGRLIQMQPLRFLLADDPGAGKTIMSGLYIRELMLRGDMDRCLIVAPGSLVEQWQEELADKFDLHFDIMSRDMVEAARTGNPFQERNLLIARLDQLSRSEELQAKLGASDWDLVIVDEAHKMSARLWGDEVNRTLRFQLGELLRDHTRNFLLLSATPHNGSNDDFLLFMSLLDPDRFAGRLRKGSKPPDVSDVMRRLVKENLLTFAGTRLFCERLVTTIDYDLSFDEQRLYDAVSSYVREGMGRAQAMEQGGDRRRGLAIGFALAALQRRLASSPEAIYQSLRRRREKLSAQLQEAERVGKLADARRLDGPLVAPAGSAIGGLVGGALDSSDDFDSDDFDDAEREQLEDEAIENAWGAESMAELEREITELRVLEMLAADVRASGQDRKWVELSGVLQSAEFADTDEPRKLIVFSEHRDTLNYLETRIRTLLGRAEAVVAIHGGMRREDRRRVQDAFRNDPAVRVLVATDAAGEGVNLQRANLMVNYDLPWNPNRIEQRFGRIHRIGQQQVCHLWNLVARGTREGMVFQRLFAKIEQQKQVYGEQIYDVLGDSQINRSLQELLIEAIRHDNNPARVEEVIDATIGERIKVVLDERALAAEVMDQAGIDEIRQRMEEALARKLEPGFIRAFFTAALDDVGGRVSQREQDRFEITRVPAMVRSRDREVAAGAPLHAAYERVTFDKDRVSVDTSGVRADLITPGHPLLKALIATTLDRHGQALSAGTTLVDPTDPGVIPRVLVYLEHTVTDGRVEHGARRVLSRRFHYAEVTNDGDIRDPGAEPYLAYEPVNEATRALLGGIDSGWADGGVDDTARSWATANLASPHFDAVAELAKARIGRTRRAVEERLNSEIRYWDLRAHELKEQELHGKKPRLNSGRARQRADNLEARKARRLRELDTEADLVNHAPTVIAAALVIPQGLIDHLAGTPAVGEIDQELAADTDRRAVAAVLAAERALGRQPVKQVHNNPGFDILSTDLVTGVVYQIEVKGHRPDTTEIKVSAPQVRQAQQNPERFRLAVVGVPNEPDAAPTVRYFLRPFDRFELHFAQTNLPLDIRTIAPHGLEPC